MAIKVLEGQYVPVPDSRDLHAAEALREGAGDTAIGLLLLPPGLNDDSTWKGGVIYGRGHFNCCVNFRGINVRHFSH